MHTKTTGDRNQRTLAVTWFHYMQGKAKYPILSNTQHVQEFFAPAEIKRYRSSKEERENASRSHLQCFKNK